MNLLSGFEQRMWMTCKVAYIRKKQKGWVTCGLCSLNFHIQLIQQGFDLGTMPS